MSDAAIRRAASSWLAERVAEHDGPMLRHGLKRLHQTRIYRPRSKANKPDPELLEYRYSRFVRAAGNAPLSAP